MISFIHGTIFQLYLYIISRWNLLFLIICNIHTHKIVYVRIFSLYSLVFCTSSVLLLFLDCPAFYLPSFLKTHNKNIHTPGGIFFFRTLFVHHPYFFLCLGCLEFWLFVFTYNTKHKYPYPRWDFFKFFFFLCTLSALVSSSGLPALPLVLKCTTHTTQTSMPLAGFEPATPVTDRL